MKDFKKLQIWRESHQLVLAIYRLTRGFPSEEKYGLVAQMRRAAVSIPTNIAEGYGRSGDPELLRFMRIALGSANELEYQLLLVSDLDLVSSEACDKLASDLNRVKRRMVAFSNRLESDIN